MIPKLRLHAVAQHVNATADQPLNRFARGLSGVPGEHRPFVWRSVGYSRSRDRAVRQLDVRSAPVRSCGRRGSYLVGLSGGRPHV